MNMRFVDVLDDALQRQANQEPLAVILADSAAQAEALRPLLLTT